MISSKRAWTLWFLASIFYAYQYTLRVLPNIMIDDITSKFQMDAYLFSQFSGIYYIGYTLMHLPIGIALDRFSLKRTIPALIMLAALGNVPILFEGSYLFPLIGRLIVDIGSSAAILNVFIVIKVGFPVKDFTKMLSFAVTIGLLGAIYGGEPLSYLNHKFGYEKVIYCLIALGCLLSIATYYLTPNVKINEKSISIRENIKTALYNKKVILICIFAGMMVGPLEGFADVWGSKFFSTVYNLESDKAAGITSLIFLGMCFGSPILNYIAAKKNAYFAAITICAFTMAATFYVFLTFIIDLNMLSLTLVLVGFLSSYQIIAIYKATTYADKSVASLTAAIANMVIMMFGYLFHTCIGKVVSMHSTSSTYSVEALTYGISVIPVCLLLAGMGFTVLLVQESVAKRLSKSAQL